MKTSYPDRVVVRMALALFVSSVAQSPLDGQAGVLTWHNDNARTGQNLQETSLTPANVSASSFGRLFTLGVDGRVDAEPLYVPRVSLPNQGTHNMLFVVTEHDSVYGFDADTGTQLWHVSLLLTGETTSDNRGCGQVSPEIGITSTPVVDPQMGPHGTMYVVAMSKNGSTYHQRLHALDITTGGEMLGGPVEVQATYPGHGDGSAGGVVTFDPKQYKDRAGLLLWNGTVYTSWASHCDIFPYTGWVIGYNQTNLSRVSVLNLTPNGSDGAIWSAGAGPAADASGNIYLLMANGTFDTTLNQNGFPVNGDYGNAFVKIGTGGTSVADYFTMNNTMAESNADEDLGSGGAILLPPLNDAQGQPHDLAVGAGKDGHVYVVDRANMGKFNLNVNAVYQEIPSALGTVFSTPAWFNGSLYYGAAGDTLKSFTYSGGAFANIPASHTLLSFPYPGTTPSISANASANGIVWAAENSGTAVLHAYDAANLGTELYNSNQAANSRDHFGAGNKYIVPMVVNGKVYVGTTNGVGVFGLFCGTASVPFPASGASGIPLSPTLSWTAATGATSYDVALSTTNPPSILATGLTGSTYTVTTPLVPGTQYYWYVVTHNCAGTTQSPVWSFTTAGSGNQGPTAVSVSPSSGSGSSQQFTFVWSDAGGYANISSTSVVISSSFNSQGACYFGVYPGSRNIWFTDDNGAYAGSVAVGSSSTLQNSQCTVSGSGSTLTGSGNNLTLTVTLTFKPAFGGPKSLWMFARNSGGQNSNWLNLGSWTVPGSNQPPAAVSVAPPSGSGLSQQFTFVWSNNGGFANITSTSVVISSSFNSQGACYFGVYPGSRNIWFTDDSGAYAGSVPIGSSATLQNSQCTVSGSGSTLTGSGNNLTLVVTLTFKPAFGGTKSVWMFAQNNAGLNSNWQNLGNWTVPGTGQPPAAVSVTPASGSGASQQFAFVWSNSGGFANITSTSVVINSSFNSQGACYFGVYPGNNSIWFADDNGAYAGSVAVGSSATLQNSQCVLSGSGSALTGSGNNLTLTVTLTFKPAFSGTKSTWMFAQNNAGLNSNWQKLGSWIVP